MPSLYEMSIPIFVRSLGNLSDILKKAEQWADENKVDHAKLTNGKIADDMKPLTAQIQMCGDTSKGALRRLAGIENVVMEDNETTFDQLQARIEKTVELLKSADPKSIDGKEDAEVVLMAGPRELKFTGLTFLQRFSLPNFFFHFTTAYDILRNAGVPLGKMDFLGNVTA